MGSQTFDIDTLGQPKFINPIAASDHRFGDRSHRILCDPSLKAVSLAMSGGEEPASFEVAGPEKSIFFEPGKTRVAIVTCGGLCPGINSVIRALVMQLWFRYELREILGVRYGYQGFDPATASTMVALTPDAVVNIHEQGGSILGSSRGSPGVEVILSGLKKANIDILFVIGGDGTMRGANVIYQEIKKQGLGIGIVGIPKTIDNDIPFVKKSFGFETAVAIATSAARSGHVEAKGIAKGIGLVKLMGRNSGYIAANATLALGHANYCLIPEVDFDLDGPGGLLDLLEQRFKVSDHALIIVAEGAGQKYFNMEELDFDASGNRKLGDIGVYLKSRLQKHFRGKGIPSAVKYIDPSYLIRAAPANPADNVFCSHLAQNAVHAAMAGRTGMLVGFWHGEMTYVPFSAFDGAAQQINPEGNLWFKVLETTGQPARIVSH